MARRPEEELLRLLSDLPEESDSERELSFSSLINNESSNIYFGATLHHIENNDTKNEDNSKTEELQEVTTETKEKTRKRRNSRSSCGGSTDGILLNLFIPTSVKRSQSMRRDNHKPTCFTLAELENRCIIQILERSISDGSITQFRVHDLLLELAIREAEQKNFLKVFSTLANLENNTDARLVTFQLENSSWENAFFEQNKLIKYTKRNVRTLIFFGEMIPFDSQFKFLRVLMVQNYHIDDNQIRNLRNSLKGLLHLRCLALRYCNWRSHFYLPTDHLHNLQTLDLKGTSRILVYMSLLGIKTLRHVCSADIEIGRGLAPADLPSLQILDNLVIRNSDGLELLNMPCLRRLSLVNRTNSWESILTLIAKLGCLVSLDIVCWKNGIPLDIIDTRSFPSYKLLRSLYLRVMWQLKDATLNADMFPPHLTELILGGSFIVQDPILILEKLQCLKVLQLYVAYEGKQMICSTGGFPQLQKLKLYELDEWKIEERAMPMLNHLIIDASKMLKMLPDLQHVPTLNVLS